MTTKTGPSVGLSENVRAMTDAERKLFDAALAYVSARVCHPENAKGHFKTMQSAWKEIIRANRCSTARQETN